MVTICLQCGDEGFSNALIYCVNCLKFAVHRYCLDQLPATFDEFVYWVCDDCVVEVPQHFSSVNSEPFQLENGDDINSKHVVEPSFKKTLSKRRKTGNVVLDTADHMCEDIHSEQLYKVHAEIKLTESALLASDCSPLKVSACDSASPTTKTKKQILPRSSSLEFDDVNNEVGPQQHQSPDDNFLRETRIKKKRAREFSSEIFTQRLEDSPQEQHCQAYTENNSNDHNDSVKLEKKQASPLEVENKTHMRKEKKNKESVKSFPLSENSVQRTGHSLSEQPCESYTENNLNDHNDSGKLEKKQASPSNAENKAHKRKKKKNTESAKNFSLSENSVQRTGYSLSEQPCESYTKNNLNERKESTELEMKNASLSDAKMEHSGHQSCNVNIELEVTVTSNQVVEFSPLSETNKKKRVVNPLLTDLQGLMSPENPRFGPDHPSNNATLENYELAQPLADPIWRGSFNVLNGEYDEFEGMVAHLSKKACEKAYEEARLFPTLLDLEMLPKLDVWPKSFQRSEPSGDSIALYFFPAHKRYERMFDHLVEQMMSNELAMKAILENAELLVFTSTDLPLNYWRFQGKYYLWGVFRGKQPPSANPLSNNHAGVKEDAEHTEMEQLGWKYSQSLNNCSPGS